MNAAVLWPVGIEIGNYTLAASLVYVLLIRAVATIRLCFVFNNPWNSITHQMLHETTAWLAKENEFFRCFGELIMRGMIGTAVLMVIGGAASVMQ